MNSTYHYLIKRKKREKKEVVEEDKTETETEI